MASDFTGPVNIGSDEMVTIDQLVAMVAEIAGKKIRVKHVSGPTGVRGRNLDNTLIRETLGWAPSSAWWKKKTTKGKQKLNGKKQKETARENFPVYPTI